MWRVLKFAARAAVWRTTPDPPLVGLPVLLGFAVAVAVVRIALQLLAAGSWHAFNPYGLNAVVAWIALELAVAALFVRPAARATALSALFVLSIVADLATAAIKLGFPLIAPGAAQSPLWTGSIATDVIYALAVVWWVGAMVCVVGSLEAQLPEARPRLIGRVAALWVALFVANALVPHAPVFLPPNFDPRSANWWEVFYALHQEHDGAMQACRRGSKKRSRHCSKPRSPRSRRSRKALPISMRSALPAGAIRTFSSKNSMADWNTIASVLPIKNHTIRLINRSDTLDTFPLANLQNFRPPCMPSAMSWTRTRMFLSCS